MGENIEVSKKYEEFWEGVKEKNETINGDEKWNMGKISKKLGLNLMMICH